MNFIWLFPCSPFDVRVLFRVLIVYAEGTGDSIGGQRQAAQEWMCKRGGCSVPLALRMLITALRMLITLVLPNNVDQSRTANRQRTASLAAACGGGPAHPRPNFAEAISSGLSDRAQTQSNG